MDTVNMTNEANTCEFEITSVSRLEQPASFQLLHETIWFLWNIEFLLVTIAEYIVGVQCSHDKDERTREKENRVKI